MQINGAAAPPVKYVFFNTGLEMKATKDHVKEGQAAAAARFPIKLLRIWKRFAHMNRIQSKRRGIFSARATATVNNMSRIKKSAKQKKRPPEFIDGKKIKADTFYTLKNGEFVEVTDN